MRALALLIAVSLVACSDADESACPVAQLYDPAKATSVELWPDPLLVDDADTAAGVRLAPEVSRAAWIGEVNSLIAPSLAQASAAGGYARGGGVLFRFTDAIDGLPQSATESTESAAATLFDLDASRRVPFEVELSTAGDIVTLEPLEVLRPGARHLAVITDAVTSPSGCVGPSPVTEELLRGDAPEERFAGVATQYAAALADAGVDPASVVAATTFVTHADHGAVVAAAEHASARSYAWASAPTCDDGPGLRGCDASFEANDYRHDRVVKGDPAATYALPVTLRLPSGPGPHPLIVFGHGLGGARTSVSDLDAMAEELGVAMVAVDALRHGDHPTAAEISATAFLGLDVSDEAPMDTLALKSNFNQTNLDRLQLIELLRQNPDIDGDGVPDIDTDRIAYWGISLGGLLGPGLLALSTDIELAILSVGGGKLTRFVRDSSEVEELLGLLETLLGGPDEFRALMVVTQSLVDGGDPMLWGAHVLGDRLRGDRVPHLLLPLAQFDEVVPPSTGMALARALQLPQVRPVAEVVEPLEAVDAPVSGNLEGRTVGYFQFDRVGDPPERADHGLPVSDEAMLQARHFLATWLAGSPEIIDPYAELGTPEL